MNFSANPELSIVIPCYNAAAHIRNTLASVQKQHWKEFAAIIIDDGSTDSSAELVRAVCASDKRFRLVRQANRGVAVARNLGVQEAKGKYIAFLDADDVFFENSIIERMRVFAEEDEPDLLGVFCPAVLLTSTMQPLTQRLHFTHWLPNSRLYFSTTPECSFNPSSVIVKKEAFMAAGGFDESVTPAEDYELWHRLMRGGGYFRRVGACLVGWTQHSQSASHSKLHHHYNQWKRANDRIYAEDLSAIPEFAGGFGAAQKWRNCSARALNSSMMAFFRGERDAAEFLAGEISRVCLEQTHYLELFDSLRFAMVRSAAIPEEQWENYFTADKRSQMDAYLNMIERRIGRESYTIQLARQLVYGAKDACLCEAIGEARFPLQINPQQAAPSGTPHYRTATGALLDASGSQGDIELLSLTLLADHKDLVAAIYSFAKDLQKTFGWHYILDFVWILKQICELPQGSVILDAGAGNGLLQFILVARGYKVVSVDFAPRPLPGFWKAVQIAAADFKVQHEYIDHLRNTYGAGSDPSVCKPITREQMRSLLKEPASKLVYYQSDITRMSLLDDESVDAVVSVSALEHNDADGARAAAAECERVLKRGGKMAITVSASDRKEDWYHEQCKGWCWTEETLRRIFGLGAATRSNFSERDQIFKVLRQEGNELHRNLAPFYFKSGNNGMPWGKWDPKYLPVGILKVRTS